MRTTSLWTVAACLVALAMVARADEKDEKKMQMLKDMSSCCKTTRRILTAFHYGGITCGGKYLVDKMSTFFKKTVDPMVLAPELRDGCLIECIYDSNDFLNEDKTIRVQYLMDEILKKTDGRGADVRPLVESGLKKCFELLKKPEVEAEITKKEGEGTRNCKQAPQLVLTCIAGFVLLNCPESDWKNDKDICAGKREQYKKDLIAKVGGFKKYAALAQEQQQQQQQQ